MGVSTGMQNNGGPWRESEDLARLRGMLQACIQCGTCTGSCPNAFAMDPTPRRMWRMLLMGREDDIFDSKTFYLCSACYSCTLRCPRGLELTAAMSVNPKQMVNCLLLSDCRTSLTTIGFTRSLHHCHARSQRLSGISHIRCRKFTSGGDRSRLAPFIVQPP